MSTEQPPTPKPTSARSTSAIREGLRGAGTLALAGMVANGAGVLVTIGIARLLTTRNYGAQNLLVSVFLVLAMPGYAVLVAVVRGVSHWKSTGQGDRIGPWIRRWRIGSYGVVLAVVITSVVGGPWIARSLSLPDASGVAPIFIAGACWVTLSIDRGLIQAYRAYNRMARNLIVEGLVRTIGTLILVAGGDKVQGAMIAILASAVFADVDARISLHRLSRESGKPENAEELSIATAGEAPVAEVAGMHSRTELAAAFAALALLAALYSLDVIVLGRINPGVSGPYGAVSVVSKVLFFAAMVLSGYLLPEATTRWHRGEHAIKELCVALGILAVPAFVEETLAVVASHRILAIGFSGKYTSSAPALPVLIAAMAFLGVNVLLTYYLLGVGRRYVVWVLAGAVALLIVLLVRAHGVPVRTARVDLATQAILSASLATILWRFTARHRRMSATQSDLVADF